MFIFTARVRRGRWIAGAVLVACVAVAASLFFLRGDAVSALANPKGVKTPEDRVAYLESYGWRVGAEPLSVEELLVPKEFDESYTDYLALQTAQGFDLTDYCGKRLRRYTYEIQNYPTGEEGVQLGLLIYKNRVVGGDVLSAKSEGFLHGLAMPKN
ncbi:MAG: DUF4830 domain-containing protein [Oscillospiraceae bacterium]